MLMLCACDDNVQLFRDAALQLDNTRHTLTDEFDYWPDCGIRVTGSHLASCTHAQHVQARFRDLKREGVQPGPGCLGRYPLEQHLSKNDP